MRNAAEDGVAIVSAMMAMLLISALGAALLLISSSETIIAAHFRDGVAARYAAEAAMARAVDEIAGLDDWVGPIAGLRQSALVDGAPSGPRTLPDGSTIDLRHVVNIANCEKATACSDADLDAATTDRPWSTNNPRWQLYAYGPLSAVLQASNAIESPPYVLVLLADDPAGTHRTPPVAGGAAPAWEGIAVRTEAFGPRGAHKVIEVVAGRTVKTADDEKDYNLGSEQSAMRILSWREVR